MGKRGKEKRGKWRNIFLLLLAHSGNNAKPFWGKISKFFPQ